MSHSFATDNEASRRELRDLIASLSDPDLASDLGNGWTVSTVLCHLAFWDRVVLRRLVDWQRSGIEPQMLSQATDSINDAARELSRSVPVREAARIVLESAEAIDAFVAQLDADFIGRIEAAGFGRSVQRSIHRREHVRRIREVVVGRVP